MLQTQEWGRKNSYKYCLQVLNRLSPHGNPSINYMEFEDTACFRGHHALTYS